MAGAGKCIVCLVGGLDPKGLLQREIVLVPPGLLPNALQHKRAVNLTLLLRDSQQLFLALEDLKTTLL